MTVTDNVFPQSGDADFAENFATWLGRGNISDFVETGMGFTVDYVNNTLTVSQGKAFIVIDQSTISSNTETRLVLDYAVTIQEKTGVPLNVDETNNLIYLNANIGTNDSPSIEVETTTGAAADDWLLIGVIDTLNDTSETRNREPSADFTTLSTLDTLNVPVYSDLSNASASESSVVYADGTGNESTGLYVYDGTSYISAGIREIDQLDDVTGVDSLTSNTDANQPAAGTAGRVYIDETNNRIERDTGSSWITIGTNPSNIGAGDLGFNPATQVELDDHIAINDAHHTRPSAGKGLKDQSNTFNFEPGEVSGQFITDDGSDNIAVQIGRGLEGDGSGQIQIDENTAFNFNASIDFNGGVNINGSGATITGVDDGASEVLIQPGTDTTAAGVPSMELDIRGDIVDDTQVIWDTSSQEIPDSALGSIDNSTLTNDSVTVVAGDGLKNGGTVALGSSTTVDIEPADFAGSFLSDDGFDNLQVNIARGLESNGSSSIQVDEDTDFTFTATIDFTAGLDVQGNITDGTQNIWNATAQEIPDSAMGSIDNATLTNSSLTVTAGTGLSGGGSIALGGSSTIAHGDTSAQGDVSAPAGGAISDLQTDQYGHITGISTVDFDSRFLNATGDVVEGVLDANTNASGRIVLPVGVDKFAT